MRHRRKLNHLSRKSEHRKAMLANMASSLIEHKRITTTVAKAKALRVYIEPLITKAKNDSTHSRRQVFSYLQNKDAVSELFREVAAKVGDRPGGYTRILKTGTRLGDNADMCLIELVDYNENMLSTGETAKEKAGTRRSRRAGKKKTEAPGKPVAADVKTKETADIQQDTVEEVADTVVEEAVEGVEEETTEVSAEAAEEVEETVAEEPEAKEPEAEEKPEAKEDKEEEKKDNKE
jgi:large subunit ribosomal protein L17